MGYSETDERNECGPAIIPRSSRKTGYQRWFVTCLYVNNTSFILVDGIMGFNCLFSFILVNNLRPLYLDAQATNPMVSKYKLMYLKCES